MKADGDSTLQCFESRFSMKLDEKMLLPESAMVSSLHWLKSDEKVLLSGYNMPLTVLKLN